MCETNSSRMTIEVIPTRPLAGQRATTPHSLQNRRVGPVDTESMTRYRDRRTTTSRCWQWRMSDKA